MFERIVFENVFISLGQIGLVALTDGICNTDVFMNLCAFLTEFSGNSWFRRNGKNQATCFFNGGK